MGLGGSTVEKMEINRDVAGLIEALDHKDSGIRDKAQSALVRIGKLAVEPLIHTLKDENDSVRKRSAEALGKIGDARAVEPLIQALMDEDSGVRQDVAWALGRIGDVRAVESLAQVLSDKSCYVRWKAAEALDGLGWKPRNDVEKAHYLIAEVSWGELVILGEPSIEPLIQTLKDEERFVREAAEETLQKIKANTLAKISMTRSLVHVFIHKEPFEATQENIVGCLIAAFPEESKEFVKEFDPVTGSFTLRGKKFGSSSGGITFKNQETTDYFNSWIKSARKGVHFLPRQEETSIAVGPSSDWGAYVYILFMLERVNPEFAHSTAFIRKWSVIAGDTLVIGVYSVVPQEVPIAPTVPAQPQLETPKSPEAPLAKKYCVYCGTEMIAEALYCPKCGKKSEPPSPPPPLGKIKSRCIKCGQKMIITSKGVFFFGAGEPNIVKLRCERCDITRFEKKADMERELGRNLPREFTLTPSEY